MDEQEERLFTIRGLFRLKEAGETGRRVVKIDEVEPAKEIVKRFALVQCLMDQYLRRHMRIWQ